MRRNLVLAIAPICIACGLFAFVPQQAAAADERPPELRADAPPRLPSRVQSGTALEKPARQDRAFSSAGTDYRSSGEVVGIEVRPDNSTNRYLLMDTDGDGDLETRRNALEPDISTNSKRLFSWD